jgi:hypothetical protein
MHTKIHIAHIYIMALTLYFCSAYDTANAQTKDANPILLLNPAYHKASAQIKDANTGKIINIHSLKDSMQVTVTGKAKNAKWGAIIVTKKSDVFYINKLNAWDARFYDKKMEVTGVLRIINHTKEESRTPDGHIRQAFHEGPQYILDKATWKQAQFGRQ